MRSGRTAHRSGLAAEEIAAALYLAEGFEVLARRWRCPAGEIDLILGRSDGLVFVEVKARRSRDAAAAAIGPRQARRLGQAAEVYLGTLGAPPPCRFDVVLVDGAGRPERIENALAFDGFGDGG